MPLENKPFNPADGIFWAQPKPKVIAGVGVIDPDTFPIKPANGQTVIGRGGKPPIEIKPKPIPNYPLIEMRPPITGNLQSADIFNIKPNAIDQTKLDTAVLREKEKQIGSSASFLGGSTVTLFVILLIIGTIIYFKTKSK